MRDSPNQVLGDSVVIDAQLPDTTAGRDIAAEMKADPPLFTGSVH